MTFSVVQRRALIGTLRALGVTRREVFALVLGEAFGVALLGTAVGLAAGVLLGRGLVRLVTQTINDLYFVVSVRELAIPPEVLLKGAAVGIGATLLAALVPAIEATQAPPAGRAHPLDTGGPIAPGPPARHGDRCGAAAARRDPPGNPWREPRPELRRAVRRDPGLRPAGSGSDRGPDAPPPPSPGSAPRHPGTDGRRGRRGLPLAHGGGHRHPGDRGFGDRGSGRDDRQLPPDRGEVAGDVAPGRHLRLGAQPGGGLHRRRPRSRSGPPGGGGPGRPSRQPDPARGDPLPHGRRPPGGDRYE